MMPHPRFVILSDLHAHPWPAFASGDGAENTRLTRTLQILRDSLVYAATEGIPWVFAGDLIHTAGYALNPVLSSVTGVLADFPKVPKLMIWGNHDARGIGGRITIEQTVLGALRHYVPGIIILDTHDYRCLPQYECIEEGWSIGGAGYQADPDLLVYAPPSTVGVYHQTVRGSVAPNGFELTEGIDAQELLGRHQLSIVGHVHHPQQITAPKGQGILIPGSPEQQNFGDRDEHGWWVAELPSKGNPKLTFMPGGSPEFRIVDTPDGVKDDGNYYRVRKVPPGAKLPKNANAIAPTPTIVERRDTLHGVSDITAVLQAWMKDTPPAVKKKERQAYLEVGQNLLITQDAMRIRDLQVQHVRLENFCCFAEQEFTVRNGTWLITGKGKDYPSNGAGKTTLLGESLYWLLFGKTTKGLSADEVVRWGEHECQVSATFTGPKEEVLVVIRTRGPNGHTLFIEHNGGNPWEAASVTEMTTKLSRWLGITPEIFQNLGYFSQERLLLFSSATDGERKNVLADLIGLSAYQEASSAAGKKVLQLQNQQVQHETRVTVHEEETAKLAASYSEVQEQAAVWEVEHTTALKILESACTTARAAEKAYLVEELQDRIMTRGRALIAHRAAYLESTLAEHERIVKQEILSEQEDKLMALRAVRDAAYKAAIVGFATLDKARSSIDKRRRVQEELHVLVEQRELLMIKAADASHVVSELRTEQRLAGAALADATQSCEQAEAAFAAGVCPTCGQPVSAEHRIKHLTPFQDKCHAQKQRVHAITKKVRIAQEIHRTAEKVVTDCLPGISGRQSLLAALDRTAAAIGEHDMATASLKLREGAAPDVLVKEAAEARLATRKRAHEDHVMQRVMRVVQGIKDKGALLAMERDRSERHMNRYKEQQNPHTLRIEEIVDRTLELQGVIKDEQIKVEAHEREIAIFRYWQQGFSKQGLQSLLVEEVATLFNEERGEIFPMLTRGVYDVQFSTLSRTKSGDLRERTEFFVYEHGSAVPYGALSGGQRRRIDIGIMLVLATTVAKWMGTHGVLGMLLLDEVFGFLDASGAEGLVEALQYVQATIPAIYVISHDTHLQALVPDAVCIEQSVDGISRVIT